MFTCQERGSHLIHLFDSLPEEKKIVIVAIIFFILGILSVLCFLKHKELSTLEKEEELKEMDKEITSQLREIELLTKGTRINSAYEELLKEVTLK